MEEDYTKIELTWDRLRCEVVTSHKESSVVTILSDVHGYLRSGQICAVMGPSGAGKTTMMDILSGRVAAGSMKVSGDLLVNGKPANMQLLKKSMCYVMQQDHLPHTETVRECLQFNAALRLPRDMAQEERTARVNATLKELGLEVCADTLVGSEAAGIKGISGGQMRRLSVAQELITSPSCIFLDEPTSGLDSEIAVTIMQTLAGLASRGRTIMLTIHQPNSDISELFNDFILMARGRVVYAGPWLDAVGFFEKAGYICPQFKNPTDYFMRVITTDDDASTKLAKLHESRWASTKRAAFEKSRKALVSVEPNPNHVAVPIKGAGADGDVGGAELIAGGDTVRTSPAVQAYHLAMRNFRMWRRHPLMIAGEGVQYLVLSLFVGGMYFNIPSSLKFGLFERQASIFYMLVTVAFTPPFTAVTIFNSERGLLRREVNQHTYSLSAFFLGKTITLLPMEALGTLVVSIISYFMFGLQSDAGKFFIYTLVVFLTLLTAESLGLLFALITKTAELAIVLMSLFFIVILSFTGFLTPKTPVYYEWLQHLSFLRYSNSALFINEMQGLTLYDEDGSAVSGEDILKGNPLNNGLSVWANIAVLASMLAFIRLAALIGLHMAHTRKWL